MKTASCTKCDRTFEKPTQILADQALRMHVGRKHTRSIAPGHEDGHSGVLVQRGNGKLAAVGEKKRKYVRRAKAQHVHVNFCPNCGCNMNAVAQGIIMAAQMK